MDSHNETPYLPVPAPLDRAGATRLHWQAFPELTLEESFAGNHLTSVCE